MARWYAVQKETTDAWDYGSHSYTEAVEMLKKQGAGLIAIIEEDTGTCVEEITGMKGDNPAKDIEIRPLPTEKGWS